MELPELTTPTGKVANGRAKARKVHGPVQKKLTPLCQVSADLIEGKIAENPGKCFTHESPCLFLQTLIFLSVNHYTLHPSSFTLLSCHPPACLFYFLIFLHITDCSSSPFMYLIIWGFPSCLCTFCIINVSVLTINRRKRRVLRPTK